MRFSIQSAALALGLSFTFSPASAQQHQGDVIENSLPSLPGSEITYFRIRDKTGQNDNLTLINYYSTQGNGERVVESELKRAVVIIHGLQRNAGTYEADALGALSQAYQVNSDVNTSTVAVMTPYFPNGDDKDYGYPWTDGLAPRRGSESNALVWKGSQWSAGGNNQYPYQADGTSSYDVLDQIIEYFDDRSVFPHMNQIVIAGHSLGAQTVQRYAAIGQPTHSTPVSYWIGNANSFAWLSTERPQSTESCAIYDDYREGYSKFEEYPMTYATALVASGREAIQSNFASKAINWAKALRDFGDVSNSCAPETQGNDRFERFLNFIAAFKPSCEDPASGNCDTVDYVDTTHSGSAMLASAAGQARVFFDNFYGNGSRSYDFGYPRQQTGDDPYPDPEHADDPSTGENNQTYAGNMTYAGCWSDGNPRSLANLVFDSLDNTIEKCTDAANEAGYSIAGMTYGKECWGGNYLASEARKVLDVSCEMDCPGNDTQKCGGSNRLSLYSDGVPTVEEEASFPETIGEYEFLGCYTEGTGVRALAGATTAGATMTLERCGSFCSQYRYFGVEYGSECYCGNVLGNGAVETAEGECNMLCPGDETQLCGAGNRLTVYEGPRSGSGDSSTSSTGSTPTSTGTASSTSSESSASATPNQVSCPADDGTRYMSDGKDFVIQCGIDHAGGDIGSLSVDTFAQCIDTCAETNGCVNAVLSGSACYLKGVLGAEVQSGVWGAVLASALEEQPTTTGGSDSSTPSSKPSETATPAPALCPDRDGETYTTENGKEFVIQCGIDHAGGDIRGLSVATFRECIDVCSEEEGCVNVSLSGSSCYLKSAVGAPAENGVLGATLVSALEG